MNETRRPLPTDLGPAVGGQTPRFAPERRASVRNVGILCSLILILSPTLLHSAPRNQPAGVEAENEPGEAEPEKSKKEKRREAKAKKKGDCRDLLEDLEKRFREGRFDEINQGKLYDSCLKRRLPWDRHWLNHGQRIRAFQLLAETHIMLDDVDMARLRVRDLFRTDPDFELSRNNALPELARLVQEEPRRDVVSVSGTEERQQETPGTVAVVTAEQIERRGYLDLESVLHDLPGFDISRGNGLAYSNLSQRGFGSSASDRFLFLVDGIEQNDLHSNIAYLSRQYPVSNVERIEVVYGPASTIYGANAYTGVVHVITRRPSDSVFKGGNLHADLQLLSGSFDSRAVELILAGRMGKSGREGSLLNWSLTGRRFTSDEPDLSAFDDWNFTQDSVPEGYKQLLRLTGDEALSFDLDQCRGLCEPGGAGGEPTVELTDLGVDTVERLDRLAYSQSLGGAPIGFSDETVDTFLSGRLEIQDLAMGFQLWRREEGSSPWYSDRFRAGRRNGSVWIPRNFSIYLDYNRSLGQSLRLRLHGRFLQHDLDRESSIAVLRSYDNGALELEDLLSVDDRGTPDPTEPFWLRQQLEQLSTEMQTEVRLVWNPSRHLEVVTGLEIGNSSIQGDFTRLTRECSLPAAECGAGPGEPGTIFNPTFQEREKLTFTDVGFYAQASYLWDKFKVTVGGRLDDNTARERAQRFALIPSSRCEDDGCLVDASADFGTMISPRYAVVYTSGGWVAKAVYSEAFRDASSFERFTSNLDRIVRNPGLEPERVRNMELVAGWYQGDLKVEAAAYEATYNKIVALGPVAEDLLPVLGIDQGFQFGNRGRHTVSGVQTSAIWEPEGFRLPLELYANYTYADPEEPFTAPDGSSENLRIGEVARHRFNLGLDASWEPWHFSLRMNFAGARRVGEETITGSNLDQVEAYTVFNTALSYKVRPWKMFSEASLQLVVNNLLDEEYDHPGVRSASGSFAQRLPQPGRAVFLRLSTKFRFAAR